MSSYSRLPQGSQPPLEPPVYSHEDHLLHSPTTPAPPQMEIFEVDDTDVAQVHPKRASIFSRIAHASRYTFYNFNENFVTPFMRVVDPFREGIAFLDRSYELIILRLGNPLVVKRLLYVFFVVVLMNSLYYAERNDGVKGVSGGGFTDGKLFDIDLLGNNIKQYIDPLVLKENIQYISSMSRFPGTIGDLAVARYVKWYFSNNGIKNVYMDEELIFMNYPHYENTYLKFSDGSFEATLDSFAFNPDALGTQGEIEAPYIFANSGDYTDFIRLRDNGVLIDGCIVVLNYGGKHDEALKVSFAYQMGAKAVVFITPATDWAGTRNEEYIDKIGVAGIRYSPGDILDPTWTKTSEGSPNKDWKKSPVTPKIPTIPISWKDGQHLIRQLGDNGIRFEDGPYSGTPNTSKTIKLNITLTESSAQPIWNVIGTIKGREQAGKALIFGAARDSTGRGATTSASGTAALIELVKIFTSLQRQYDWSPSRTIFFASFDATEYNVAGAMLWVNKGKKELLEQGYGYIDVGDLCLGDLLTVVANPLLHGVILEEMRKVQLDPAHFDGAQTLFQLYTQQHDGQAVLDSNFLEHKNYVPFLNLLNIPSVDAGFRVRDHAYQPLQSKLNLFENLNAHFGGDMLRQSAIIEFLARLGLRLAEDPMIPYNFNFFVNQIIEYKDDLQKLINEHSSMHGLTLTDLNRGIAKVVNGAQSIEEFKLEWREFLKDSATMEPVMLGNTRRFTNENVVAFNRLFVELHENRMRPGYKNILMGTAFSAPKYGATNHHWNSFPFVRDAIINEDAPAALAQLETLGQVLIEAGNLLMSYG